MTPRQALGLGLVVGGVAGAAVTIAVLQAAGHGLLVETVEGGGRVELVPEPRDGEPAEAQGA